MEHDRVHGCRKDLVEVVCWIDRRPVSFLKDAEVAKSDAMSYQNSFHCRPPLDNPVVHSVVKKEIEVDATRRQPSRPSDHFSLVVTANVHDSRVAAVMGVYPSGRVNSGAAADSAVSS